jgi:peptidoglycan hydrolase CwlO-like protein
MKKTALSLLVLASFVAAAQAQQSSRFAAVAPDPGVQMQREVVNLTKMVQQLQEQLRQAQADLQTLKQGDQLTGARVFYLMQTVDGIFHHLGVKDCERSGAPNLC